MKKSKYNWKRLKRLVSVLLIIGICGLLAFVAYLDLEKTKVLPPDILGLIIPLLFIMMILFILKIFKLKSDLYKGLKKIRDFLFYQLFIRIRVVIVITLAGFIIAYSSGFIFHESNDNYCDDYEVDALIRNTFVKTEQLFNKKIKNHLKIYLLSNEQYQERNSTSAYGYYENSYNFSKIYVNKYYGIGTIQHLYIMQLQPQLNLSEVELKALAMYMEKYLGYIDGNRLVVYYGVHNPRRMKDAKNIEGKSFNNAKKNSDLMYTFFFYLDDQRKLGEYLQLGDMKLQEKVEQLFNKDIEDVEKEWLKWLNKYDYQNKLNVFSSSNIFYGKENFMVNIKEYEEYFNNKEKIVTYFEKK